MHPDGIPMNRNAIPEHRNGKFTHRDGTPMFRFAIFLPENAIPKSWFAILFLWNAKSKGGDPNPSFKNANLFLLNGIRVNKIRNHVFEYAGMVFLKIKNQVLFTVESIKPGFRFFGWQKKISSAKLVSYKIEGHLSAISFLGFVLTSYFISF